ncbi:hypothetical protein B0H17DRAFT_1144252 [Mycena rosella]|uniref:Ubiquitin-like protease family profile domain-containing protein n=1 Tax=Mycena rosella TaxID=1033263 RepID=A0AAD7G6Y5_MYCRO|nr:hypothetical protein B0H17DRAFT_1144252 [Mycena rosella]
MCLAGGVGGGGGLHRSAILVANILNQGTFITSVAKYFSLALHPTTLGPPNTLLLHELKGLSRTQDVWSTAVGRRPHLAIQMGGCMRSLWLILIHRIDEEHWALVVVVVANQQIVFFDNLGSSGGWRCYIRDIMVLITRMVVPANRNKYPLYVITEEEAWIACPLFNLGEHCQSNGHDCGLWVLCMMGMILRGNASTGVTEA